MESSSNTATDGPTSPSRGRGRGRGRGKSRGGLGKYLRARGRGRGGGRPAEFRERLVLDGERTEELDEEEAQELQQRYSRRQLGTNADRYVEDEPELDSDGKLSLLKNLVARPQRDMTIAGEPIPEPEVDLSKFLERQRLDDAAGPTLKPPENQVDEDDVDHTLAHISGKGVSEPPSHKGKVQQIEWDPELEAMSQEKAAAEASRGKSKKEIAYRLLVLTCNDPADLKSRFRAKAASSQRGRPSTRGAATRKQGILTRFLHSFQSSTPIVDIFCAKFTNFMVGCSRQVLCTSTTAPA